MCHTDMSLTQSPLTDLTITSLTSLTSLTIVIRSVICKQVFKVPSICEL